MNNFFKPNLEKLHKKPNSDYDFDELIKNITDNNVSKESLFETFKN